MDNERILDIVASYADREFGGAWVHPRGTRALGKLQFPLHHIHIGGWYPDVLGLRDNDHIVAISVAGNGNGYLAELGRALTFRRGAHYAVLAGDFAELRQFRDAALDSGVGVLAVTPDERVDLQLPAPSNLPLHNDVRRELGILAARNVRRRITSLGFEHPVHFLAPIMAIRPDTRQPKQEVASLLMDRWGFDGSRTEAWWSCFYGALFLGLVVETDEELGLSELGGHTRNALLDRHSAAELRELVQNRRPLMDHAPDVALVLRSLYLAEPDVALLVRMLGSMESTGVGVEKFILRTLRLHPNAGVNLFFRTEHQDEVLERIRSARYRELFEPEFARKVLLPGVYGAFKCQLIHLGFLQPSCPLWMDSSQYDPGEDIWIPRR